MVSWEDSNCLSRPPRADVHDQVAVVYGVEETVNGGSYGCAPPLDAFLV